LPDHFNEMAGRREKPEDILLKLRQVEVLQGQGRSVQEAVQQIGVTVRSCYRSRREYGGMSRDQFKRLKELEAEKIQLRPAVLDMTLAEAAGGKLLTGRRLRSNLPSGGIT